MRLSNLNQVLDNKENVQILRDGEFEYLGLMQSKTNHKLLTFVEKLEYIEHLPENISCLICSKEISSEIPSKYGIIVSDKPRITYFKIHNYLGNSSKEYYREQYSTVIGQDCKISENAIISENNVTIGNNVIIEERVVIRENVTIGDNSIIRAGAIIGGEGFEFKRYDNIMAVKHCGGVIIGNNVEIQYNTCLDKAVYPWDNTVIGNYSKLDNFIHVGHAVKIGERTLLAANATIGGRTEIGSDCWIGVSASITNGIVIGNNCKVNIGAVATRSIEDNSSVTGNFAIEHSKFIQFIKSIR